MIPELGGPIAMTELMLRLDNLSSGPGRKLLGITGPPGVGKSTLAAGLVGRVRDLKGPDAAVLVPMDGFHLAQSELERLGRANRKGAPDTFDADGFVALLHRLRGAGPDGSGQDVYAPEYRRGLRNAVAGALRVPGSTPLVVVEGNYLLVEEYGFGPVDGLLDEVWYLDCDPADRLERLIARHVEFGKSPEAARAWALGPDERNAALIEATRMRAHVLVVVDKAPPGERAASV